MTEKKYPAIQIFQHDKTMYVLSIPAGELLDISKVDEWRADVPESDSRTYIQEQGYQRQPMPRHYTKVATYASRPEAILPTSILLSARRRLSFERDNSEANTGFLAVRDNELPLYIIDGQHRLEGIRHAIYEKGKTELLQFPLVVCIIDNVSKITEVNQFHIINSTAKGIRTDLADRLLLMMEQVEPSSVRGSISAAELWRLRATQLTVMMGAQGGSPWEGRIHAPNTPKGSAVISERSFSTSLRPIVMDGTMSVYGDEQLVVWLTGFWTAIAELMPDAFDNPQEYAVQKTPGVYTYHILAPRIFSIWRTEGGRGKEGIARILTANSDIRAYFTRADFWRSGSGDGAGMTGMSGFARLASDIAEALPEAQMPDIGSMF